MVGRDVSERVWRKSSYSGGNTDTCVEVAVEGAHVLVRDSKRCEGPMLVFPAAAWCGLLAELENPAMDGF
nr:DUF397 domain-containing protein [Streptomyces tailanensis]